MCVTWEDTPLSDTMEGHRGGVEQDPVYTRVSGGAAPREGVVPAEEPGLPRGWWRPRPGRAAGLSPPSTGPPLGPHLFQKRCKGTLPPRFSSLLVHLAQVLPTVPQK